MFESLTDLVTSSATAYAVIAGFVALDAVFPVVPGETLITTGAVLAANDELSIVLVILSGVVGGVLGDNVSYLLGAKIGTRIAPRLFSGERGRSQLRWAREQLRARGAVIIVAARFIPGGRTATTFAAGTLAYGRRRFVAVDLVAVALWSCYAAALGWFGGEAFQDSLWKPLLIAVAVASVVALAGEAYRRRTTPSS